MTRALVNLVRLAIADDLLPRHSISVQAMAWFYHTMGYVVQATCMICCIRCTYLISSCLERRGSFDTVEELARHVLRGEFRLAQLLLLPV